MNGVGKHDKSISQFLPLQGLDRDDADRHYRDVHTRFARNLLRAQPQVLSYHINRAEAEFDLNGDWLQRPRAFRFVVLRFLPGRSTEFSDDVRDMIVQDHRVFLRELRGFRVDEEVVVNRLSGQTALVKYLFEFERFEGQHPDDADRTFADLVAVLRSEAEKAFGLRQIVVNRVISEGATEPVDEPGQRSLDQILATTTKHSFLEVYFDQLEWAQDWFSRTELRRALQDPRWALARGYRVSEECGLDRR